MTPAQQADHRDQYNAGLDEELAAVKPVDRIALQRGVCEKTMKEKSGGSEVDAEMKRLPQVAAQLETQIRCNDHEGEKIEGNGADGVFKRLAGRVDRVEKVHDAKARVFVQQQNGRMQKRYRECDIARPIVEPEVVEPAMRPGAVRAIPKRHEHPEEQIQSNHADRNEPDIGGKVEDSHAHWRQLASIGFETARSALTFQCVRGLVPSGLECVQQAYNETRPPERFSHDHRTTGARKAA